MMQLMNTIWALILNCLGISVFRTCFSDAMEDDYGDYLLSGPPITSMTFAFGVYTIISHLNFYPSSFRQLIAPLLGIYEFLVTAFILDFSLACLWTPIDIHIYTTFTTLLYEIFIAFGFENAAIWLLQNKAPKAILCCILSMGFFIIALHITKSIDFMRFFHSGAKFFVDHVNITTITKIASKLPKLIQLQSKECRNRKNLRFRRCRKSYKD